MIIKDRPDLVQFLRPTVQHFVKTVQGETIFIVGGGTSLDGFDFSRLDGRLTIGINQAAFKLPSATALFWVDDEWAARNEDTLNAHACKARFYSRFNANPDIMLKDKGGTGGSTVLYRASPRGFSPNIDEVSGNNSGCCAINLCINAGVKRIVLLGFDMKLVGNRAHYHNSYTYAYTPGVYESFLISLESMLPDIEASGVEIINCSMISDIPHFKKVPIEDILNEK